jgi:spoIIIJ-associated protein
VNGAGDQGYDNVITRDETTAIETRVADVPVQAEPEAAVQGDATGSTVEASEPVSGKSTASDNPLDGEAEIAADYLEELLDIADLDGDIDTYIEGDRAHVSIVSESTVLVGDGGVVLDALQELTRLAVMTETGDRSRLMLDVAGYRERRRQQLLGIAADAIQAVKDTSDRVPLAPMNPFERKIVHDAVAAAGLVSKSEGEEPKRHVIVLPA